MEPLGIIVFSCIMGTAGFSVILEAVRQLLNHTRTELPYAGAVVGEDFLTCTQGNSQRWRKVAVLRSLQSGYVQQAGAFEALHAQRCCEVLQMGAPTGFDGDCCQHSTDGCSSRGW